MNASELVERVVERTGLSRRLVRSVLDTTLDEIVVVLATEERVSLSGFGTFDVRRRSSRRGRNPITGDALTLPDRRAVLFHAGRGLRKALAEEAGRENTDAKPPRTI